MAAIGWVAVARLIRGHGEGCRGSLRPRHAAADITILLGGSVVGSRFTFPLEARPRLLRPRTAGTIFDATTRRSLAAGAHPTLIEATPFEDGILPDFAERSYWMLVLSRKINETIVIGGDIRVTMTAIHSRQVRLAIDAPRDVPIIRQELLSTPPKDELDHGRAAGLPDRDRVRRIRGVRPGR